MKTVFSHTRIVLCALLAASAIFVSGCNGGGNSTTDEVVQTTTFAVSSEDEATAVGALEQLGIDPALLGIEPDIHYDNARKIGFQLDSPEEGDTIAVIHTSMGDIKLRLFPEQAPKTVTNFINLAEAGKYDNTMFHRVINDFIIQGGHCGDDADSPNGVSSYGSEFEDEFCDKLFNIRGAVSMANTSKDSNGSQFFINQTDADAFKNNGGWTTYEQWWENVKTQLINYRDSNLLSDFIDENGDKCYDTDIVPERVRTMYELYGGNPNLDGAYNAADRGNTVFAQVIEGMGVVDKIAAVSTDKDGTPEENVVIMSIEITEYTENGNAAAQTDTDQSETEGASDE